MEHDRTLNRSKFSDISGIYEFRLKGSRLKESPQKCKLEEPPTKEELPGECPKEDNLLEDYEQEHSLENILNGNVHQELYN